MSMSPLQELSDFLGTSLEELKGVKGDKGDKGDTGADSTVPGPRGPKGDKGDRGDSVKGDPGKDGRDGTDGTSADEEVILTNLENKLPGLGARMRDGLELLQDEERLDAKAIKNLPEATKEVVKQAGWGAHPLIVQDEGTVKDKVTRVLNFKGAGVSVERTAAGVTEVTIAGEGETAYTDEMAQDAVGGMVDGSLSYVDALALLQRAALTGAITASAGSNATLLGSFTKAQLDAAVSDGNVLYTGDVTVYTDENAQDAVGNVVGAGLSYDDGTGSISSTITQYTDENAQDAVGNSVGNGLDYDDTTGAISVDETELTATSLSGFTEGAQDAVGAMVDTTLGYTDGTPLLSRAALTGHITAAAGSNATVLGSFTLAQLNTAVSDANIIPEAGGTFTGDVAVPDEAYGAGWDGSLEVPTKNAVYDVINALNLTNITRTIVTTTGDVTMGEDAAVDYIYVRNSDDVITFPTAVGNTNRYTIKNRYTTPLTPLTTSSQTIDGRSQTIATSDNALVIFPNEAYDFLSDGSNWYTI